MSRQAPLSHEHELLLLSLKPRHDDADRARLEALLAGTTNWPAFVEECTHHFVGPLVYERLSRSGLLDRCEEDARQALQQVHRYNAARNLALLADVSRVTEALAGAGLRCVVYKGMSHAVRDYRSLAARMMADADLLLHPEDFGRAHEVLEELGYEAEGGRSEEYWERYHGRRAFFREVAPDFVLGVEIHRRIGLPPSAPVQIVPEQLMERAVRIERNGVTLPALELEDEFVVMACHQYRHEFETLRCPSDAAVMLAAHPGLDWDRVMARARETGLRLIVYAMLALTQSTLGTAPPDDVMQRLRPGSMRRWALRRALTPARALKRVVEGERAAGPGQIGFRMAALLCGEGWLGPWRLLWSRFWRHQDEVWLTEDGVPRWARSRPLFAGYRIATLAGRVAGTAVRRRRTVPDDVEDAKPC